ncbi:MAG TPA: hypothetical protein VNO23_11095 [Candidatus Binatia bacterium]|nr:hypothetical protein [Candidatus Binatia bacterium]
MYTTGNDLGDNHVFVPIEAFRAVFRPGKKLTKIFVTVDSVGNVERVVQDLKDRTRFPEVDVVTTPEVSTARTTLGSLAVASVYASILWIVAAVFAEVLHGALGLPVAFDGRVLGLVGVGSLVFAALGSLYPVIRGRLGRSDEECPVGMAKFGLRRPSPGSATWSGRRGSPSSPPRSSPGTPSPTPSGRRCLVKGYAGSREVLFQHTEVSDPKVAERLTDMMKSPVLVVPSLTQAPETLVARVWVFTNGVRGGGPFNCRPDVFDHPPGTPGYRPLRAIHLVADMPLVTWPGGGR